MSRAALGGTREGQVVQISGQYIYLESGAVVTISGQAVDISGGHVFVESGAIVLVSGQFVYTSAEVSVDISGQVVFISGQSIYVESGAIVLVSGQTVKVSGETTVVAGLDHVQSGEAYRKVTAMKGLESTVSGFEGACEEARLFTGADAKHVRFHDIFDAATLDTIKWSLDSGTATVGSGYVDLYNVGATSRIASKEEFLYGVLSMTVKSSDCSLLQFGFFKDYTQGGEVRAVFIYGDFQTQNVGTAASTTTAVSLANDTWYNIDIVWTPTYCQLWVNGELRATHTTNIPSSPALIYLWTGIDKHAYVANVSLKPYGDIPLTVKGAVPAAGMDISGHYVPFRTTLSGEIILASGTGPVMISGQVVQISGQHIYVESGAIVLVSGQFVYTSAVVTAEISGQVVQISGQAVDISGAHVFVESGAIVLVSGQFVYTSAVVTAEISGQVVQISGQWVDISGAHVFVESGAVVQVSGQFVYTSAEVAVNISGQVVQISGQAVNVMCLTDVKTHDLRTIPATSGGVYLHSGTIHTATLKAKLANSGDIFVGGNAGTNLPYSGHGFELEAGEALTLDMCNFDDIKLYATVSGDRVTFIGAEK